MRARFRIPCLIFSVLAGFGCNQDERIAKRLFDKGKRLEKAHQYSQAADVYHAIQKKFPKTAAARQVNESVDFEFISQALNINKMKNITDVKESLGEIAKAVGRFYFKENRYPARLDELVPAYMAALPRDPWGARFSYAVTTKEGEVVDPETEDAGGYLIAWFGKDRIPGGSGDDADIVVSAGRFIEL